MEGNYVTFKQAKWLKEKGLNKDSLEIECNQGYDFRGDGTNMVYNGRHIEHSLFYSAPEQWQVVEWLRVNHGIWICIKLRYGYEFIIQKTEFPFEIIYRDGTFKSPQEAYSAAFDYILNDLI